MGTHDMLWRDPLSTPGDRFPLGPPPDYWAECHDEPSEMGIRPYCLRGVIPVPTDDGKSDITYSYDPVRQIGLVRRADGQDVPLAKHTKPGATRPETSGYPTDGDPKNPPPEEMHPPDYQSD
ncbi:MAG: putative ATP-grasp-modified RiPP [Pseudonocardia sp.]|jgi:putative ATP-grasp target RiPP|nr:putative ATP-grasp-modified RiPP [Pseudonocardia sp.]